MNLSILRNSSKLNSLNIQLCKKNYLSSLSTHNRNAILTFPSLPPITSKKLPKSGFSTTPILGQRGSTRHLQTSTAQPSVQPKKRRKMEKLTEAERAVKLQPLLDAGWTMVPGRDGIYKEYRFPDFIQAFSFMSGVAVVAEKIDHHPEWFNVYNKLNVTMFTHDCQGLSDKDIKLATFMDSHVKKFL